MEHEPMGQEQPEQEPPKKVSRYEKIKEQIAKLQKEKQGIENRRRAEERQARRRRLIEIGDLTLQHLNLPQEIEPKAFAVLLQQLVPTPGGGSVEPPPDKI